MMQTEPINAIIKSKEDRRKALIEYLTKLSEDEVAIINQFSYTKNGVEINSLKRQREEIKLEMNKTEDEIKEIESNAPISNNRRYLKYKENLHEIDFDEAKEAVEKVIKDFGRNSGYALFILQDNLAMAGNLCVTAIREKLKSKTGDFKYYQIAFTGFNGRLDEFAILDGLARRLNVEPISDIEQYTQKIIHKICNSIISGSIVFLEFNQWHNLSPQEKILPWFLSDFWVRLINKLPEIEQTHPRVKFVTVITHNHQISQDDISFPCFCDKKNFDGKKMFNLPLSNWTEEDIKIWLEDYQGFPISQSNQIAKTIYQSSKNGTPQLVCQSLEEELT